MPAEGAFSFDDGREPSKLHGGHRVNWRCVTISAITADLPTGPPGLLAALRANVSGYAVVLATRAQPLGPSRPERLGAIDADTLLRFWKSWTHFCNLTFASDSLERPADW